jgi:hypothetical protein
MRSQTQQALLAPHGKRLQGRSAAKGPLVEAGTTPLGAVCLAFQLRQNSLPSGSCITT